MCVQTAVSVTREGQSVWMEFTGEKQIVFKLHHNIAGRRES